MISTERLTLRNFIAEDRSAIESMLSDSDVVQHMHFVTWSEEQRRQWFDWCLENNKVAEPDVCNWAITLTENERLIGWLGIGSASSPSVGGERDFGYFIARGAWSKGYMTETLQAVLAYEFDTLKTPYITATCDIKNPASARVMQKAGMMFSKTVPDTDALGNASASHHYAICNPLFTPRP